MSPACRFSCPPWVSFEEWSLWGLFSFMLVNIIKSYRNVVAICDSELLGKYFEENLFQLDIKESFYKGDAPEGASKKTEDEIIQIIKDMKSEDATFNIVGERAVNAAIKAELISKDSVRTIQGIPFVLVFM